MSLKYESASEPTHNLLQAKHATATKELRASRRREATLEESRDLSWCADPLPPILSPKH